MSLSQVFEGIRSVMPPNVKYTVGAPEPYGLDGAPRVVWVPVSETIVAPMGHGGDPDTSSLFPGTASLATRQVICECHVWGQTMDLTEQLRDIVHNAINLQIWGAYQVTGARWINNDGQIVKHGHLYVMDVTIFVPVQRPADLRVHVTQFTQTCQMNFLNGNVETV